MSIQTIINGLIVRFNNDVKSLLNYCNSNIKSIMNSSVSSANKNNNIKQIQNYFNTTYINLKNKLNSDIKAAQAQAQLQAQAQAQAQAQLQAQAPAQAPVQVTKVNKNALLIGCNYIGTQYQLSGCINDVENIQTKLKTQYGFNNILIMSDNTSKKPIKVNILDEIKNLLTNPY